MDIERIAVSLPVSSSGLITDVGVQEREKQKAKLVAALQTARAIWAEAFGTEENDAEIDMATSMSPGFNTILQRVIDQDLTDR